MPSAVSHRVSLLHLYIIRQLSKTTGALEGAKLPSPPAHESELPYWHMSDIADALCSRP